MASPFNVEIKILKMYIYGSKAYASKNFKNENDNW